MTKLPDNRETIQERVRLREALEEVIRSYGYDPADFEPGIRNLIEYADRLCEGKEDLSDNDPLSKPNSS